jgi:hypothetical protein
MRRHKLGKANQDDGHRPQILNSVKREETKTVSGEQNRSRGHQYEGKRQALPIFVDVTHVLPCFRW